MPLSDTEAVTTAKRLLEVRRAEAERLNRIHEYTRGRVCRVYIPRSATNEYKQLVDMSRMNVLPLVVAAVAQNLFVEGYRGAEESTNREVWRIWQANRMDARQAGVYRSALTYGASYALVLRGKPEPVIRPYSPRNLTAVYEDPVDDEWPIYALACRRGVNREAKQVLHLRLLDDTNAYELTTTPDGGTPELVRTLEHGLGVCPAVRFTGPADLDDGSCGEVEPLMPLQDQINQTTFGLLMAQQYSAFRQRWATGMALPEDPNGNPIEPFNAAVNRLWVNEDGQGKFGEFDQTDLDGYLESRDSTLRFVSAVAQVPPQALMAGKSVIANISAEGLAAIEAGMQRKVAEYKVSFGEADEQMLRLAGKAAGDEEAWEDVSAQVDWRDTESRSLAQVADALGKLAQMLSVPPQALWERIPGVTPQDIERWKSLAKEMDGIARLDQLMNDARASREPVNA